VSCACQQRTDKRGQKVLCPGTRWAPLGLEGGGRKCCLGSKPTTTKPTFLAPAPLETVVSGSQDARRRHFRPTPDLKAVRGAQRRRTAPRGRRWFGFTIACARARPTQEFSRGFYSFTGTVATSRDGDPTPVRVACRGWVGNAQSEFSGVVHQDGCPKRGAIALPDRCSRFCDPERAACVPPAT